MEAGPPWPILGVAAVQAAVVVWLLARKGGVWRLAAIAAAGLLIAATAAARVPAQTVALTAGGVCHAGAYAALLAWFAGSLRPGREPVVTGLARRMRRTMPPAVIRYTRRVTIAWCAFFAAELVVSALLLLLAPRPVWSAFVNLGNLPAIAAMMGAEFACRAILFRHDQRTSLRATLAGLRQFGRVRT